MLSHGGLLAEYLDESWNLKSPKCSHKRLELNTRLCSYQQGTAWNLKPSSLNADLQYSLVAREQPISLSLNLHPLVLSLNLDRRLLIISKDARLIDRRLPC